MGGILLEPWTPGDLWLLRRINEPAMTEFTGGPEPEEKALKRFERYVAAKTPKERVFKIVAGTEIMGSIGFWEMEWKGASVYETGWAVLPEFNGRGVATEAARAIIEAARAEKRHRFLVAFPKTVHAASNAICRKAGFTLVGGCEFEYPKGTRIRCNEWRVELWAE